MLHDVGLFLLPVSETSALRIFQSVPKRNYGQNHFWWNFGTEQQNVNLRFYYV